VTVFVTDTHAIVWRLVAPSKLAAAASEAFDLADSGQAKIHVPAVVLAEMVMVAEKGRVPGLGLHQVRLLVDAVGESDNFWLTELSPDLVMASARLSSIPDIFDRLVAAEAIAKAATLISRDHVFSGVPDLKVAWE